MITTIMLAHLTIPSLLAACLLASCATPGTSQGLSDIDGDGLGEKVTVLERPQDQQTVLLHLQKIEARQEMLDIVKQGHLSLERLRSAGRVSSTQLMTSEAKVAKATIRVIDTKLALARTGLLPADELMMLDTDGDGLPDMQHTPLSANKLLEQKLALSLKLFEQSKLVHADAELRHEAGRRSILDVHEAERLMYAAKLDWLKARMERDTNSKM